MSELFSKHGGFRKLRSFQVAQQVYDGTVYFCNRFIDKRSRTHVQNIAEGSLAAATSSKMELKLTGVARASLGELLVDFEDYLRHRGMVQWSKDHPKALKVRDARPETVNWERFGDRSDEELANILLCLINQASYLLWRQMQRLEQNFLNTGGFTERMYHARKNARG